MEYVAAAAVRKQEGIAFCKHTSSVQPISQNRNACCLHSGCQHVKLQL